MANTCFFYGSIHGTKEDVLRFKREVIDPNNVIYRTNITSDYSYEDATFSQYEYYEHVVLSLDGECDWSIVSSMGENLRPDSVYKNMATLSREYNLIIDMFGEEDSIEFQEHYVWYKGDLISDQCIDKVDYTIEYTGERLVAGGFEEFGETFLEFRDMTEEECHERIIQYDPYAVTFACDRVMDYCNSVEEEYEDQMEQEI